MHSRVLLTRSTASTQTQTPASAIAPMGGRRRRASVGRPPRGTVLAIHGAGHSADAFTPLFAATALADFECVAFDLPGRHLSTGPPCESAADAAARIAATLAELGSTLPRPIMLVGHSFGGAVALEVALGWPHLIRIDALVLVSTGARLRVLPERLAVFARVAQGLEARPRGAGFSDTYAHVLIDAFEAEMDAVPAATALADWHAADGFDRLADLARIDTPTLVLGGDADPFTPLRYAEFLTAKIPGATLVRLEGGSHLAVVEQAAACASAIAKFASELTPSP